MKRRIFCLLLVLALFCQLLPPASAAGTAVRAANALYTLGLLQGVGQHSDGSPIYGLDRDLSRQEAVVLLIRLLGMEALAEEFRQTGTVMTLTLLILGNAVFFLLDRVLSRGLRKSYREGR